MDEVKNNKCKKEDIIMMHGSDMTRYCDFSKQVVIVNYSDGPAAMCYFLGYERRTRSEVF